MKMRAVCLAIVFLASAACKTGSSGSAVKDSALLTSSGGAPTLPFCDATASPPVQAIQGPFGICMLQDQGPTVQVTYTGSLVGSASNDNLQAGIVQGGKLVTTFALSINQNSPNQAAGFFVPTGLNVVQAGVFSIYAFDGQGNSDSNGGKNYQFVLPPRN